MGGSANHFRAMRERRQERKDTHARTFVKGKEKFTTTSANFNFPKLEKNLQRKLQASIKKRLVKEQRNRNIKAIILSAIAVCLVIVAWKYLYTGAFTFS